MDSSDVKKIAREVKEEVRDLLNDLKRDVAERNDQREILDRVDRIERKVDTEIEQLIREIAEIKQILNSLGPRRV